MGALEDIARAPRTALTRSKSLDPDELLVEARRVDANVTLDELTAARLAASEYGNGGPAELACVIDAGVNQAAANGESLTDHLTDTRGRYGPQDASRPASTRQNANLRHLAAARAVLAGGELAGIALGARRFFSPRSQDDQHRAWKFGLGKKVHSCSALGLLTAWSYVRPKCSNGRRCCADGMPPASPNGKHPESWVGPIDGVNPYVLMLLRPSSYGPQHDALYQQAATIIRAGSGQGLRDGAALVVLLAAKVLLFS
jgi:hypothetical protein